MAYRAFSTKICAEIKEQTNPGETPCTPAVAPSTPPNELEFTAPATGERKHEGLDGGTGWATDPSTMNAEGLTSRKASPSPLLPEEGRPTSVADDQTTERPPGVIERDGCGHHGGDSGDANTGSTFLTDVRRAGGGAGVDDVEKCQQKKPITERGIKSTSRHGEPDDHFIAATVDGLSAAPFTNRRVVKGGNNIPGSDKDSKGGGWQWLIDGGRQRERATKGGLNSAACDAKVGESPMEGSAIVGIEAGGGTRRGPGRLWDRGRSPSDSFDKQRVTLTSAR